MLDENDNCIDCQVASASGTPAKFCATCTFKGASLVSDFGQDQLLEKNGKKFAKIFLISSAANVNRWRVTSASIPERIRTFIGRPYISEPGFAHFNADKMSPEEIIKKQEQYRAGTIKEVVLKEDLTGFAIVEFENTSLGNKVFKEMKQGKAIYSSPAIAGKSISVGGERVFVDWYGLHLARVGDPAYGVFHASIKETCEGETCMEHLVSTANVTNDTNNSSIISIDSSNQSMSDTDKIKELETLLATATSKIAETEKALADAKAVQPVASAEVDCEANPDHPMCKDKKATASKVDAKEFARLQAVVATIEQEKKQTVIDQIVEMKATANIIDSTTETEERESLSKLSFEVLTGKAMELEPMVNKIVELASLAGVHKSSSAEGRIVTMPPTGFASATKKLPENLGQLKGGWF